MIRHTRALGTTIVAWWRGKESVSEFLSIGHWLCLLFQVVPAIARLQKQKGIKVYLTRISFNPTKPWRIYIDGKTRMD